MRGATYDRGWDVEPTDISILAPLAGRDGLRGQIAGGSVRISILAPLAGRDT